MSLSTACICRDSCGAQGISCSNNANEVRQNCAVTGDYVRLIHSKLTSHFLKPYFNIILPSTLGSSRRSVSPDLSTKTLNAPLLFPIRATRPAYLTPFHYKNNIWWVQFMLLVQKINMFIFYIYMCGSVELFAGQKAQLPVCSVLNQAPGSPIRNVFIMRLCMRSYVITRLSEKLFPSSFLNMEAVVSPKQTGNGLRNYTLSYPIRPRAYMFIIVKTSNPTFHYFRVR